MAGTLSFFDLTNLQAPADGRTHQIIWNSTLPGGLDEQNFSSVGQYYSNFRPQGCRLDATLATGPVKILETNSGFFQVVDAKMVETFMVPGVPVPNYVLTGNAGDVVAVTFYDFPVFHSANGSTNVAQAVTVNNNPLDVSVPASVAGTPYAVQAVPLPPKLIFGSATVVGATALTAPPASVNLRKLRVTISGDATLAAAGEQTLSVTLAGVVVWQDVLWLPLTAQVENGLIYKADIPFPDIAYNTTAAPTFGITLGTALATGKVNVAGWFA